MPSRDYYENLARTYATQFGIDPDIFVAQIGQESNFDPTAGPSSGGAQGIAQLVPFWNPGVDTWDPDASLKYAAQLVAGHLGNYGGDIRKALTAYHAGPGILNRAMELGGAGWEGSITAAAGQLGYADIAERIGRDNRLYLSVILGGAAAVRGFVEDIGQAVQSFARGDIGPSLSLGKNTRERLNAIATLFFGRPADKTPDEPFPGFLGLLRPFERDMNANVNFREVIDRQLEAIAQESFNLLGPLPVVAIPGPGGMARYPLSIIQGVWPWGGPLGAAREERDKQQEELDARVDALLQQRSDLLAQYDNLSRLFTAVELQFDVLQNEDPEIRLAAQSELDQLIATNSAIQRQMMEPVLTIITDEMLPIIEQLTDMSPEEIAALSEVDITEKLFEDRRARPIASYLLTTEQLRLSLMGFRPSGSPDVTTGEQLRQILMAQGLDSEEAQAYREDTLARVEDRIAEYRELERNIAALVAGSDDWKQPKPGVAQYLKIMAVQPLLVATVALEKYFRAVPQPIAGIVLRGAAYIIPGEQAIERDMDAALEDSNYWQAAGEAWRANTWHPVAKFAIETLADPTSYIGWGIATKLVKPIPILGRPLSRLVASAEYGYLEMANAPFRIVGTGLRGLIKRPAATIGAMAGESIVGDLMRLVTRANPGTKFERITAEQVTETLAKALDRGYQFPEGIGIADLGVIVSKSLRAQAVPDTSVIMGMVKRAGGTLTRESLESSKTVFLDVETRLVAALDDPNKTGIMAQQLMTILGVEDTASGRGFAVVKSMVEEYVEAGNRQAGRLIQGDSLGDIFNRIATATEELTIRNHESSAAIQAINQGRLSTMLGRAAEGTGAVWSGSIEKWMIRPLARSYLLFGMYHLWNVAETKGKALLAGINPFFRGNRGQMYVNAFADSAGARTEVLLGGGRGLMWGETFETVQQARRGMEKFLAPKALSKLFREELAIKIQAADQALINYRLALRELKRIRPEQWAAIDAARKAAGPTDFLPRELRPWLDDATEAAILQGPDAVKLLPGELTPEKLRSFNIERMLGQYENIDSHMQAFIMGQAKSGRLFSETEEVGKELLDLVWEKHLRSPEFFALNFEEMAEEILTAPINSYEDLSKRLLTLQGMSRGYGGVLEHQYNIAREASGRVIEHTKHDNIYNLWRQGSEEFGNRAGASLDTYINSVRQHLNFAGEKVADVELYLNRVQALRDLDAATWSQRRIIQEQRFGSLTPKERTSLTNEWWYETMDMLGKPFRDNASARKGLITSLYTLESRIGEQTKNAIPDVTQRVLSRADIAVIYGARPNDVSDLINLVDLQAIMGRDDFIQEVWNRALINLEPGQDLAALGWTEESIGKVWDDIMREFRLNPDNVSVIAPTLIQVEDLVRGVRIETMKADILTETVEGVTRPTPAGLRFTKWADDLSTSLEKIEGYTGASWLQAKGEALESATTEFYRMFPDYVDLNYLDKFFRSQFPFWVYEWHRLWYLPRQFMRTPGLVTGMGRYNEATGGDNYIHVPFTSLEINPLRGTILMGGLRRLLVRDYPEFYDNLPMVQQALDVGGRWGFYPGAHVTIGNLLFGTAAGPQWDQIGEIIPVWMKAPVQAFQAFAELTGNDTMIQASKRLAEIYIPERFRNYMISLKVSQIGAKNEETGEFINGADLNSKMMAGTPLNEFEQALWDRATGEMSGMFLLMDQTGLFRFRPEEKQQALKELDTIYSEYTGFTVEQLENMRKWDINPFDIIPPSPEVRDLLNATEYMQRWAGATNVLFGASEQQFRAVRNEFFTEVNKGYLDRKVRQEVIDCQWGFAGATSCDHPGSISSRDWNNSRSELGAESRTFWNNLRSQERYRDIPMTMDDEIDPETGELVYEGLISFYTRTGQPLPVEHPAVELMRMYFDIQLVEFFDPETGALAPNFDLLYMQQEIFLQTLGDYREEIEPQIRESDTELEKLRRWSYTQYLRPYYNRRDLTISRFPPDAQIIINKWLTSDNPLERDQLEAIQFGGRSLIGKYQEDLRRAGQRLRLYSPDIDAWVAFWGAGQHSFQTDAGQARYIALMQQYRPGRPYDLPEISPAMLTISEEDKDA